MTFKTVDQDNNSAHVPGSSLGFYQDYNTFRWLFKTMFAHYENTGMMKSVDFLQEAKHCKGPIALASSICGMMLRDHFYLGYFYLDYYSTYNFR